MALVTEQQYHIDATLKANLDYLYKRSKKNFDIVIIIDGIVRSGKSTLAKGICHYLASKSNRSYTPDNIHFDIKQVIEAGKNPKPSIIHFDEAALAAKGTDWQNKLQKTLIKLLEIAAKNNHYWVLCLPAYHTLKSYIALDRSDLLIHTYLVDNFHRGQFVLFGRNSKHSLYYHLKQKHGKEGIYHMYQQGRGRFLRSYEMLIDHNAYEAKKDKAIGDFDEIDQEENKEKKWKSKFAEFVFHPNNPMPVHKNAEIMGVSERTLYNWRDLETP